MDKGMKRGQPITFRIPSDTPDHILKQLTKLREVEKRNFSSTIASFVLNGVGESMKRDRETLTIPLPKGLTKEQRDWLKHEHSEALLGSIVYQLLADPVRAVSILASLNSNALDIDEALYLQEEAATSLDEIESKTSQALIEEQYDVHQINDDDDLSDIDWNQIKINEEPPVEEEEIDDNPLADFLAQMNR